MRLIVDNLTGSRGPLVLFEGLSFVLTNGEALQVTGPNGSGKSTLLRIIAGLIEPEDGSVRLESEAFQLADALHYLGHQNAMKDALTVRENLSFWRAWGGGTDEEVAAAIDLCALDQLVDLPFSYLSAGQKRRTALARLLVAPRPIWLLDEPTAALDAKSTARFAEVMEGHLQEGGIIIAATHLPLKASGFKPLDIGGGSALVEENEL